MLSIGVKVASLVMNVSGYTIRQIEDCLGGATSFNKWKTNINNKYPNNATKQHLQELFNAWYI